MLVLGLKERRDQQVFSQPRPTDKQENGVRTRSLGDDLVLLCEEEGGVDETSEEVAAENIFWTVQLKTQPNILTTPAGMMIDGRTQNERQVLVYDEQAERISNH